MDPRLVRLYQDELTHLREVGGEFAAEFPKIASRLGMEGMEVSDPYVERLLEGFAFLAARVQLKLEAEQPRLIAHLLESIYPNFLAPVPSMMVARLGADPADPNLARGHLVPRGASLQSLQPRGQDTYCEFRTAMAVTLWPIELAGVQYFTHAPDLSLGRLPQAKPTKGGLRIKLRAGGGLRFDQLKLDRLGFYIAAPDDIAFRLHELVLGTALGTLVVPGTANTGAPSELARQWRGPASVQPAGFTADEALLPETLRAFSGHRLLQELAALPQRLLFFDLTELSTRLAQVAGDAAELVILFSRGDPALETLVDGGTLALFCTPAINLFQKRLDRVQLGPGAWEYHLVPDRTRPMDMEVHSVEAVVGHGTGREPQREFKPLFTTHHEAPLEGHGYFTVRREPRLMSQRQRQQGPRSSYIGEELFLSLVDAQHGAYREHLRQLSVIAWCSNRDLPALLPQAGASGADAWKLDAPGPVSTVTCMRGPTRPVSRRPTGDVGWSLVSQLTQNHLSLSGTPEQAAAGLRDTLRLYGPPADLAWSHQVDGLLSLRAQPIVRRLPFKGPLSFGSGIDLTLEVDELRFQGSSAFLLTSVLEQFFARHAAINSFTQLSLRSQQRGLVKTWAPHLGDRSTL
ncbi:type VI secretion system baseplate subunit TssF [Aquincola sp. S2]|uniref:Type VI secretion system baseplate subunit TssF n=1 Tax=Pseudaquabacterium terrae TaxID=2732868 RepID=A0ABX2ECT1_9BURK|nr:type VI secretion system baseplate subunit TssF [Aquabacterium terrae]NRF66461.1 type VI secretion system baseplate subunit TssF [Aquabacterium terrae]